MIMRGIILAAGRGKRMGDLTDRYTKAMLPLHGKPLIEWQIQAFHLAGISQIAIVTGYKANVFSYPVKYFHNTRWEQTNMFSSLLCAEEWLREDTCLISYSDIVYDYKAIETLSAIPGDIAVTYDPKWLDLWQRRFEDPLSDAEVFKYQDSLLNDIGGKTDNLADIQGQYMGLLKFTTEGWRQVRAYINGLGREQIDKLDMTALLKLLLTKQYKICVAPVTTTWCEIDNINDYHLCHELLKV